MSTPAAAHSSVRAHLATEHALLLALYGRSKAQHRAQAFLRKLEGVLRLTRLVLRDLDGGARLPALVRKLVHALLVACSYTTQMLALHHFVPLQTLLIASYGRLFAVSANLAQSLGVPLDALLASPDAAELLKAPPADVQVEVVDVDVGREDFGEKIDRASLSLRPTPAASVETSPVPAATPPGGEEPKPKKKKRPTEPGAEKPKGRKKDAVDDIFAEPKPKKKKLKAPSEAAVPEVAEEPPKPKKDVGDDKPKKKDVSDDKPKKKPKSKKKKDAMDDIFGF